MPLVVNGTNIKSLIVNGTTCKSAYANGVQVYNSEKIIFENGNNHGYGWSAVSGSYSWWTGGYTVQRNTGWSYARQEGHRIYCYGDNTNGPTSQCGCIFTTSWVDFSGFTTLHFQGYGSGNSYYEHYIGYRSSRSSSGPNPYVVKSGSWSGELTMNISGVSGGYIGISIDGVVYNASADVSITKIWLT